MRYLVLSALCFTATVIAEETQRAPCPHVSMIGEVNLSYDNFHTIPDGNWNGNNGILIGCNFGLNILDYFGMQWGGSYAAYDWYGKPSLTESYNSTIEQQEFVTGGFFRRSGGLGGVDGIQGGIVVDWMFNQDLGILALNPNMGQLRMQLGYLIQNKDELGAWGTVNLNTSHNTYTNLPITYRAISQVSLFWRHIFGNRAETMLWGGVPYKESLLISGSREGAYLIGFDLKAPFSKHLRLDAHGVYMGPVGNSTAPKAFNYNSNIAVGITYSFPITGFRDCSRCTKAKPYFPIGNNSNLLVDTNWID